MKERKNTRAMKPPIWRLVLEQLLLTGLVLCVFAMFHHVIPRMKLQKEGLPAPVGTVEHHRDEEKSSENNNDSPGDSEESSPDSIPVNSDEPEPTEPVSEPWSVRFAEHFSDEPRWEDSSYSSPSVSVTITKYYHPDRFPTTTYFVADIYLADIHSFRTGLSPHGIFDVPMRIARENNAILAINGDSMLTLEDGFLVRNGDIYKTMPNGGDLCVLYYDGTMVIYDPGTYTVDEILEQEPFQIWQFGPSLLDENGDPLSEFNTSEAMMPLHPRTAIGYYEPGHYCFVVVDGRQGEYSMGADMHSLAEIMSELGCKSAYNLDGGGTSVMVFNGMKYNSQPSDRFVFDMVIITEPEETEDGSD